MPPSCAFLLAARVRLCVKCIHTHRGISINSEQSTDEGCAHVTMRSRAPPVGSEIDCPNNNTVLFLSLSLFLSDYDAPPSSSPANVPVIIITTPTPNRSGPHPFPPWRITTIHNHCVVESSRPPDN